MSNYGYQDDEVKGTNFTFGLNAGKTFLKKFEYTPNGGRDGAAQEALDIIFNINGTDKGYRQFPITKAFDDSNNEVTDPNHPAMIEETKRLGSVLVHIIGCFVDKDQIKAALSTPITSFKQYCDVLHNLLPANFSTKSLDIFMQWQYKIRGEQNRTFLELPKNMKQGKWLIPTHSHKGAWIEKLMKNPSDKVKDALYYVDSEDETNIHPFVRSGWFVNSPWGSQQKEDDTAAHNALSARAKDDELPFVEDKKPNKPSW